MHIMKCFLKTKQWNVFNLNEMIFKRQMDSAIEADVKRGFSSFKTDAWQLTG